MTRSKYGAKPTTVDGIRFASMKEAARYAQLRLMQSTKLISSLTTHPRFVCCVNGKKVCTYIADFRYMRDGQLVVEDVKSKPTKTPVYRLKIKILAALYPDLTVMEV